MSEAPAPPCPARAQGPAPGPCEWQSLGQFLDRSGKLGEVTVEQCRHCGHGRSRPPLADVSFLYDQRESQDFQPHNGGLARLIKHLAFRREAKRLIGQLEGSLGSVLDFGCGSGQFTRELGDLVGRDKVVGSDFFAEPPAELAGRPYLALDALDRHRGEFDTVLAMHVLEHDDDVAALLDRIVRPARQGGKIVIEVPNIACFGNSLFGRHWDGWYLPYHRSHFSRRSLVAVLEQAGLEVLAVHGAVVPTMGRTFANLLGLQNTLPMLLAGIVAHPVQLLGEWLTGEPSALRAIARKR